MGTLLKSKEALRSRVLEVSLAADEVTALIANRVDSLPRLAFAACPPGESPPSEQIDGLFAGRIALNQGTYASMKRPIFEAQACYLRSSKTRYIALTSKPSPSLHLMRKIIALKNSV